MTVITVENEQATLELGARLAQILRPGDVVALIGELGAGKTTLARGIIKALCETEEVPSPTYTLVQSYEVVQAYNGIESEVWHCDLYRLKHPDEAWELGLIEAFEEAICLIEWPDKLGDLLPTDALFINITFEGEGRRASFTGWGNRLDTTG